jgi:hypothetical protein
MSRRYSPRSGTALTPFAPFPYLRPPHEPQNMAMAIQCSESIAIVSTRSHKAEGPRSPEPLLTHSCCLSHYKQDRWLRWKPLDVEEIGRHAFNVVKLIMDTTKAKHSSSTITVLESPVPVPLSSPENSFPFLFSFFSSSSSYC